MTVGAILDELADTLREAFVLVTDIDIQVEPRMVLNASPPTVDIFPADPFREELTAGMGEVEGAYRFTIRARVSTTDADAMQDLLLAMMDHRNALSVKEILMADPTLNGLADDMDIDGPTGYRRYVEPGATEVALLGVEWTATVVDAAT